LTETEGGRKSEERGEREEATGKIGHEELSRFGRTRDDITDRVRPRGQYTNSRMS
jgi:hypothetical protein